jgi:hypothetical protein
MAKMTLPLVYIPADADEPDDGRFMQSDAFVLMQFASDLDWLAHSKAERKQMIRLKRKAHEAHTAFLSEIEVTKAQVELIQKICEEPMSHLKKTIKSAQGGEGVDVEDQFVNTDLVQASMMELEDACAVLLGTTVADDGDDDDDVASV